MKSAHFNSVKLVKAARDKLPARDDSTTVHLEVAVAAASKLLKADRERAKLTQLQLAKRVELSHVIPISVLENMRLGSLSPELWTRTFSALGRECVVEVRERFFSDGHGERALVFYLEDPPSAKKKYDDAPHRKPGRPRLTDREKHNRRLIEVEQEFRRRRDDARLTRDKLKEINGEQAPPRA
jgi:hypothetical protein